MAKFELVDMEEAAPKKTVRPGAAITAEYAGYIAQVSKGQAGKLTPAEGETRAAVRRRLGIAAKASRTDLVIKRAGDTVYFWVTGRRRGRRPKVEQA